MGFDWSKEERQNSSMSQSSSSLEPYLSLVREESLQSRTQISPAGNQANVQAARQNKKTLESIRFPFLAGNEYGQWNDFVVWSDVEVRLDAMVSTDRDDAALRIVKHLKGRDELDILGSDPRGRRILVRLFDELTSGSVWGDERESADSVAVALKRSLDPKAFTRLLDPKAAPVIPLSKDGLTHGSWVQAKLLPSGKIFIKPSSSGEDWNFKKNYPDFFEYQGAEFDPRDVINVVLTDESPIPRPILAAEFLAFGNANEYETLKKAIEAAAAGATLPFTGPGLGGRALLEGAAANSPKLARVLSLTAGVSESSMTLARGISSAIEFADAAAIAWGGVSFFVHSVEGGLIRRFGDDGKELLAWVHLLDTLTLIYGFSRIVADVGDLVNAIHQRSKALREAARRSAATGGEDAELAGVLEKIVDKTDELSAQQKKILELNQPRLKGGAPKNASTGAKAPLPDSATSSVQHPAFESRGPNAGSAPKSAGSQKQNMAKGGSSAYFPPETPPAWMPKVNPNKGPTNTGELRATLPPPRGETLPNRGQDVQQLAPKKPVPSDRIPEQPTSGQLGSQVNEAEVKGGAGRTVVAERKKKLISAKKKDPATKGEPTADEVQSKRLRNAQETLSVVNQAVVSTADGRYVIEQVVILGVESKKGFVPTAKLVKAAGIQTKSPGRIADVAEVPQFSISNKQLRADKVILGDYKSADKLAYLDAYQLSPGEIEQAASSYQSMVSGQVGKENAVIEYATKNNGVVLFRGRVVGTNEKVIFYAQPADIKVSVPAPYGGTLNQ